jgi:seryl-tRNA synthetase
MPDPIKSGSKVKSLESKIQTLKEKKSNLKEGVRGMIKNGMRGDVGLVKEIEGITSQVAKLESKLKEIKGSGGGKAKNSDPKITNRYQNFLNSAARNKQR